MFILRTRTKDLKDGYGWVKGEENKILGDSYYLVRQGSEPFEIVADEHGYDDPEERRIFAFIVVKSDTDEKVFPLHWTEEHYVMTATGKTFEKVTYEPPAYYDYPERQRKTMGQKEVG